MKPSIVLVGLDQLLVEEILQGFLGESRPQSDDLIDWTVDTKYYTADVHLCPVRNKRLVDEAVANSTEVLILLLDPSEINHRTKLDSWLPFLSVLNDCETKLLVTRRVDALSKTISRMEIKQWCSEHDYELLELEKSRTSETEDDEDEDEDDDDQKNSLCRDVYGIPRLIQTLHVHQWSNMNLKDRREINRNLAAQLKAKLNFDERTNDDDHHHAEDQDEQVEEQKKEFDSSQTTHNHHEVDEFGMENLFEQMRRYKEEADRLTGDERKQFAEKAILSLWKSVGDDDDLGEDSDEETLDQKS